MITALAVVDLHRPCMYVGLAGFRLTERENMSQRSARHSFTLCYSKIQWRYSGRLSHAANAAFDKV